MEFGFSFFGFVFLSSVIFILRWVTRLCFYIILLGWVFDLGHALFN